MSGCRARIDDDDLGRLVPDPDPVFLRVEDRRVRGGVGGQTQRTQTFNNRSMTNADTHQFIEYDTDEYDTDEYDSDEYDTDRPGQPRDSTNRPYIEGLRQSTGRVDIARYMAWLRERDYCFAGEACANPR